MNETDEHIFHFKRCIGILLRDISVKASYHFDVFT